MGVKKIIETEIEYADLPVSDQFAEEEQIDQCCEEVSVDECADVGKVSPYVSAEQEDWDFDPDEIAAEYEKQYGELFLGVGLIAVGPEGNCGEKHETWEGRLNCCDEVEPIVFDWDSSVEVLEPGTSGVVSFTGGRLPALVKIRGNGFSFDGYNTREAWTYSRSFYVYAHEMACGFAPITIDDGCTVAQGGVRSSLGEWVRLNSSSGNDMPASAFPYQLSNADYVGGPSDVRWQRIRGKYQVVQESSIDQCSYTCVGGGVSGCASAACFGDSDTTGAMYSTLVTNFAEVLNSPCSSEAATLSDWIYDSAYCFWRRCLVAGWPCAITYRAQHYKWVWEWRC